jgi:hypothetical protein
MRKVPPFLLLTALSACALPETRWVKEGADEKATSSDLVACRNAAQQETFDASPYYGFGPPFWHFRRWGYYGYYGGDRFYTEGRLTDFCMRNKGYALITIPPPQTKATTPQPAPTTPPPGPAASTDK